jgi:pimeloyl-ACP methyl ester carboxylesterase
VFIHGWLLSRQYWQPLISQLSAEYQCLAYDLRGFGDSQPPTASDTEFHRDYTPAAYAKDLGILLDKLGISNAWLIGHSLGGTIALWTGTYLPHQVQGIICVNSGGGIYIKEEFERFRSVGQQLVKLRPRWLCYLPWLDWLFSRESVATPVDRCWGRQRLIDFVSADLKAARGALLDSTTEAEVHQLPQIVAKLQQPLYFFAGDQDQVMEPQYVRHLASFHHLFGGCDENVIEIPNCGHLSMLEQPDFVADHIRTILKTHL